MSLPTRIYLTGFMGSGKSTLGPILARRLGYAFVDLDALVEARAGMSIPDYFRANGEQAFRHLERSMLEETLGLERVVVALGGGAVVSEPNLRLVLAGGTLVYLRLDPEALVQRLRRSRDRPLLRNAEGEQLSEPALRTKITELLTLREPFYSRAHLVVDITGLRIGRAAEVLYYRLVSPREKA